MDDALDALDDLSDLDAIEVHVDDLDTLEVHVDLEDLDTHERRVPLDPLERRVPLDPLDPLEHRVPLDPLEVHADLDALDALEIHVDLEDLDALEHRVRLDARELTDREHARLEHLTVTPGGPAIAACPEDQGRRDRSRGDLPRDRLDAAAITVFAGPAFAEGFRQENAVRERLQASSVRRRVPAIGSARVGPRASSPADRGPINDVEQENDVLGDATRGAEPIDDGAPRTRRRPPDDVSEALFAGEARP